MDPRGPGQQPSCRDGPRGRFTRCPPPAAAPDARGSGAGKVATPGGGADFTNGRLAQRAVDATAALAGVILALAAYAHLAPLTEAQFLIQPAGTAVLASDGTIVWRDMADGVRIPVPLQQVSPAVIEATIAAEDQRFRSHPGIDPLAILRAATRFPWQHSGASTITQQIARRLYLGDQALLLRKAREAEIALQLEAHYSKDEILELYLNSAYYGRGAYGIEAAARVYFGVSAASINLARAAFLAGLTQTPVIGDSPGPAPLERQRYVLSRMLSTGVIDQQEQSQALATPLGILPSLEPALAPHFVAFARAEAERLIPGLAQRPGLVIETTLDLGLQAFAEQQARLQLNMLKRNDAGNAAVVILDPRDGRILSLVGNITQNEDGSQFNMALEPRQPGSALKPILYDLALDAGFTAASPLFDIPSTFETKAGAYAPQDHDRRFRGVVTLRTALGSSLNVPAVAMLENLGPQAFIDHLHDFGIDTGADADRDGLALALGSAEVSLLDLSAAYGALANEGLYLDPFAVTRIRDAAGRIVYERRPAAGRRVVSPAHAFIITDILSDDSARTPGFGPHSILELPFRAAVKTGTTTEFRDNWTLGYTPHQVVGVWVGNVDNRPMQDISGVDGAAPIWAEVMKAAHALQGSEDLSVPADVAASEVCAPTGLLPGPACPLVRTEWFVTGTEPRSEEHYYVLNGATGQVLINPPSEARPWLAAADSPLAASGPGPAQGLVIAEPGTGEVLYLAPELPRQELVIRVGCPVEAADLTVLLDGTVVASGPGCSDFVVASLEPGRHQLLATARATDGSPLHASTHFEVRSR